MNLLHQIKENVSLADHSTFRIGGPARFFASAKNEEECADFLQWAKDNDAPVFILGAGSNILVSDRGFNGLVIKTDFSEIIINKNKIVAGAGVLMGRLVNESVAARLAGFEWGVGIPGSFGGAIRGNAGCFGGEMKDVVEAVRILNRDNFQTSIFSNKDCEFSYRDSVFKRNPALIIIAGFLFLPREKSNDSEKCLKEYTARRAQTQDIGTKTAGCMFKNIKWENADKESMLKRFPDLAQFAAQPHIPASYLIDKAGLKGKTAGNVFISPKHANFIVNKGGGTAEEVMMLGAIIKEYVHRIYGIMLEEEVQLVGF